jgi:hypothetical protein
VRFLRVSRLPFRPSGMHSRFSADRLTGRLRAWCASARCALHAESALTDFLDHPKNEKEHAVLDGALFGCHGAKR